MCEHLNFAAKVDVHRLTRGDDGPVNGYCADIAINCADCGVGFEFLGLEPGVDTQGARVSIDGTEARIAITPPGLKPNPLQRMSVGITKFDG